LLVLLYHDLSNNTPGRCKLTFIAQW